MLLSGWRWFSDNASRAELTIAVLVALEVVVLVIAPFFAWAWRRYQLTRTFKLELPDGGRIAAIADPHGSVPVIARLSVRTTTDIERMHFRFAKNRKGEAVSPEVISVEGIQSLSRMGVSPMRDGKGGCEGLMATYRARPDETFDFSIAVRALHEWSGFLIFTSRDAGERLRTVVSPFVVTRHAPATATATASR